MLRRPAKGLTRSAIAMIELPLILLANKES